MRDIHNRMKVVRSIAPIAIGTTGTGQAGKIVDRQGYDSVEILLSYGTITATAAVITPVIKHGDVTGTMTSVADADLLGTEANAGIAAGTPRTSGSNKNVSKHIGYIGGKRYIQVSKLSSTTTAGPPVTATVIMMNAGGAPVAT